MKITYVQYMYMYITLDEDLYNNLVFFTYIIELFFNLIYSSFQH